MAYLNANIPPTYAQIRREYLYDLKKHHGEVEDCIIFGISALTGRSILSIDYLLQHLFKKDLNPKMYPYEDLMNFSSGIVFLTILLLLLGTF